MTTASLLHSNDKYLEEIQQIVTSTKATNLAKQTVRATADLALIAKKKQPERTTRLKPGEKCFNYGKKGHYAKDCHSSTLNKRKSKELTKKAKHSWWKRNLAKIARSNEQDNSNPKPYLASQAFMTQKIDEDQSKEWYLDSCTSRHICHNCERSADFCPKSYEFVIVGGTIIKSCQVETITLLFENGLQLTLSIITFIPKYDSNLVSLG